MFVAFARELRTALRALARSPWFTLTCVLMLATGLGLSMYMFGAINGFILKPLPFADADRLTFVGYADPEDPEDELGVPLHDFVEIRAAQRSFEDIAGFYQGTVNLSDGERPERHDGVFATAALFSELGVAPRLGRVLRDSDNQPGAASVAVISHLLWMNRFNGDPAVLGQSVRINGSNATVVGVMPPGFRFPRQHDIWVPLVLDTSTPRPEATSLDAFGRLRAGVSMAQARAELDAQIARINAAYPESRRSDRSKVVPYADELTSRHTRRALTSMFAAVIMVLLIACANVAHLMIARGAGRRRELAIRGAIGAGKRRLVLQVMAESLIIAVVAAGIGVVAAVLGGEFTMQAIHASEDPPVYWADFSLDGIGVAFCIGVALLAAVASALAPALDAARTPAAQAMRSDSAGSLGRGRRTGRVLVTLEVAVCMALLVGAGLTVRSVLNMTRYDTGMNIEQVLTGRLGLFPSAYPTAGDRLRFAEELERRLAQIPGVESVALTSALPLMDMGRYGYEVQGEPPPQDNQYPATWAAYVTPGFFRTFEFGPLTGRELGTQDGADAMPVALANESFVRRHWPEGDALGRQVRLSPTSEGARWATIVGIVPDTVQGDLTFERREALFLPFAQEPAQFFSFALRTRGDPYAVTAAVREAVTALDADLPIYWLRTMDDWLDIALWDSRLLAKLFGMFAAFALLLAVSGIYAVLAYAVNQRTREIGVRRALGAHDRGILRMVLGQGGIQLAVGMALGLALSVGFARALSGILFGISDFDLPTFVVVAIILALVAMLAGFIPARRALKVEPMVALRYE